MQRLLLGPMEAFVVVARCGSLTQAAQACNLTVPALSRRIRLLEAHLGVQLFRRLPRGVMLTEAGQTYFAALEPAWAGMQAATEAIRPRSRRRVVRVTVMPSLAANWLMPRLVRFQDQQSGVQVEVHTSPDLEDLSVRTDLDCAIRLGKGPWPGLESDVLMPVFGGPVASPGLANRPAKPSDLLRHTLIETHHQPAFWREWFAAKGTSIVPSGCRGFDNLQVVYEAAAAGMGISMGLDPVVRPYLESGRLIRLLGEPVRLALNFHLVRRRRAGPSDQGYALFRDWLFAEAAASPLHSG